MEKKRNKIIIENLDMNYVTIWGCPMPPYSYQSQSAIQTIKILLSLKSFWGNDQGIYPAKLLHR